MIGNLTRDIELRYLPSGAAIAKGGLATSFKYKTGAGEQKDEVCFLDFNVFGKSAEIINQYVRKGSKVLLEGRLVFEQWTAQDGTNRNRHSLRVESFKFLDSKNDNPQNNGNNQSQANQYNSNHNPEYNDTPSGAGGVDNNVQQKEEGSMGKNIPEYDIDQDEIPF